MYERAELISRTCIRAKANQKLARKRESKNQFHSTKLPGIIADAKSRAPPKFRATAPLRIIFYIEKPTVYHVGRENYSSAALRIACLRSEERVDERSISHLEDSSFEKIRDSEGRIYAADSSYVRFGLKIFLTINK